MITWMLLSKSLQNNEEIFIDCQPTGADGESLVPVNKTIEPGLVHELSDFVNNSFVKMVLPAFFIFLVVKFAGGVLNSISNFSGGNNSSMSGGGNMSSSKGRGRK